MIKLIFDIENQIKFLLTHDQVNSSSITKITSWLKFLGKISGWWAVQLCAPKVKSYYGTIWCMTLDDIMPHSLMIYSTTDHSIQESIKRIINSGLFWEVKAAQKKKIQTAISMQLLWSVFYVFIKKPFLFFFKRCSVWTKKLHSIRCEEIFFCRGKYFILDIFY